MNIINKQVVHESFGQGSVVKQSDSYVEIDFGSENKTFVFPDAFGTYLTLIDQKAADTVKVLKEKKEAERKKLELELEKIRAQEREELAREEERTLELKKQQRLLERDRMLKNLKIHPSSQLAYWCQEEQQEEIFAEGRAFAGVIKSGANKGKPNRPARLHQNSVCLLTLRNPDMDEKDRLILGFYEVIEDSDGKLCQDGYINAHPEYRLRLTDEESKKMLFWNYYINEKHPHKMTWNTGRFRYFDNVWMAQILRDIISVKKETQERELAQRFFDHFCEVNRIEKDELPKPSGALMQTSEE